MDFFGDQSGDPFDKIVREFFGEDSMGGGVRRRPSKRRIYRDSGLTDDYVETPKNIFLVLDLSDKKVVDVNIKETSSDVRVDNEDFQEKNALEIVFSDDERATYPIPKNTKKNKFDWHFNNGILEVQFKK